MKKNTIMKGVLLLIVLAVLSLGFTGCGTTIISTTPTYYASYVYIDSWDGIYGDVYLDGSYVGYLWPWDWVTDYNIQYGWHTISIYQSGWLYSTYSINVTSTGQTFYVYW